MGKPIIHCIEDAIGMFMTTALDAMIVEDFLIEK
jgi:carbamoyltransferase